MSEVVAGMLIGAISGSLLTAAYLGICLREREEQSGRNWIGEAIASAFSAAQDSPLEDVHHS